MTTYEQPQLAFLWELGKGSGLNEIAHCFRAVRAPYIFRHGERDQVILSRYNTLFNMRRTR